MISYILTNGNGRYICCDSVSHKFLPCTNINKALKFENRNKAANVLRSSVAPALKSQYYVFEYQEGRFPATTEREIEIEKRCKEEPIESPVKEYMQEFPEENLTETTKRIISSKHKGAEVIRTIAKREVDKSHVDDWYNEISSISQRIYNRIGELIDLITVADREVSDILHCIEFTNFSASEGFNYSKALKNIRTQRRQYKDELYILQNIQSSDLTTFSSDRLANNIAAMRERQYEPRALPELFEK